MRNKLIITPALDYARATELSTAVPSSSGASEIVAMLPIGVVMASSPKFTRISGAVAGLSPILARVHALATSSYRF
jgi:hypothetical protein